MRSRREIREELAAQLASDGPDSERVAALTAELEAARRVWRSRRRDTAVKARTSEEPAVAPARGLTEQDRAAVESWPPELRERLRNGALTRVILPWRD